MDHCGTVEALAGFDLDPIDDLRRDELVGLLEVHLSARQAASAVSPVPVPPHLRVVGHCEPRDAHRHEIDGNVLERMPVELLVETVKTVHRSGQASGVEVFLGHPHGQVVRLPGVAVVEPDLGPHPVVRVALLGQSAPGLGRHRLQLIAEVGHIELADVSGHRPEDVLSRHRDRCAEGRGASGERRDQHRGDVKLAGDVGGMHGASPAEGAQRELAGIAAPLDRDGPHRVHHVGVDDPKDPRRGPLDAHAQPGRDVLLDGGVGGLDVESERSAEQGPSVVPAQHQVGVGDRGACAAPPVAGRARGAARGLGTDPQRAPGVDPRYRAPAGADGVDVEGGIGDVESADLHVEALIGDAVDYPRHVAARAAHVESEQAGDPGALSEPLGRGDAAGGSRHQRRHRRPRRHAGGHGPARVGHDRYAAVTESLLRQLDLKLGQVSPDDTGHIGRYHGG